MADLTPGIYEQLVMNQLQLRLASLDNALMDRGPLDPADAHQILAAHLGDLAQRALRSVPGDGAAAVARQVALANEIAQAIIAIAPDVASDTDLVAETQDQLQAIAAPSDVPGRVRFPLRPEVPLSTSALLVNGRDQPRIGVEVQKELASADRVDLLCAFVKWYGVRVLDEHIEAFVRRGGRMRVITTTYIGATDRRALDRLAETRRRCQGLVRDANDAASCEGTALSPRDGILYRVRRFVEPLEERPDRRSGMERSTVDNRAGASARHIPSDLRPILGGRRVRNLRPV